MLLPTTAVYAVVLFVIFAVLSARAGLMRGRTGISVFYGDNLELAAAMRRHANFVENVPLALALMAIAELNGANTTLLHVLGVVLVLARIAHPIGLQHDNIAHPLRALGAGATMLVLAVLAGTVAWQFF